MVDYRRGGMKFQHTEILDKDAPCPNCGQDGYGHETRIDEDGRLGRSCLESLSQNWRIQS